MRVERRIVELTAPLRGAMLPGMDFDALNVAMAESNRRARRGRTVARLMLILAVGLVALLVAAVVFVPSPCMCPMFVTPPGAFGQPTGVLIGVVGAVGSATGLIWMWRIARADPEPDTRSWRYRQRP